MNCTGFFALSFSHDKCKWSKGSCSHGFGENCAGKYLYEESRLDVVVLPLFECF